MFATTAVGLGNHYLAHKRLYGDMPSWPLDPIPVTFRSLNKVCHDAMARENSSVGDRTPAVLADVIPAVADAPLEELGAAVQRSSGTVRDPPAPASAEASVEPSRSHRDLGAALPRVSGLSARGRGSGSGTPGGAPTRTRASTRAAPVGSGWSARLYTDTEKATRTDASSVC